MSVNDIYKDVTWLFDVSLMVFTWEFHITLVPIERFIQYIVFDACLKVFTMQ